MSGAARRVLFRSVLTTVAAVLLTLAVFYVERVIINVPLSDLDIIEALLLPIAVGMPIALFIFVQAEKLRRAYAALTTLHRETARSRDQLREASDTIRYAATHDGMTGLVNRTHFFDELASAHERGDEAVLLIADVDHFKQINDRLGHLKGDEALIGIAATLKNAVGEYDLVGRVGGEEFGILLRHASVPQAADLAEAIRRRIEELPWPSGRLSVSIGGAAFADCPQGAMEVYEIADRQLYRAKRAGRNCIALHSMISEAAFAMSRQGRHLTVTRDGDWSASTSALQPS